MKNDYNYVYLLTSKEKFKKDDWFYLSNGYSAKPVKISNEDFINLKLGVKINLKDFVDGKLRKTIFVRNDRLYFKEIIEI